MSPHFLSFSAKNGSQDEGAKALEHLGIHDLKQALGYSGGAIRRKTPARCTREIVRAGKPSWFLKQYFPGFRFAQPSGFSQARAEAQAFADLREKGLPIPRLIAWGGARRRGAFLLWEAFEGEPLDAALARGFPSARGASAFSSRCALIIEAASLVRRLHDGGRVHRDLYLCHLLFAGFEGLRPRLGLIDLQRVTKKRLRRWFVKDLAALLSACPKTVTRADKLRFLLAWLQKEKLDASARSWARAVAAKARRILRHRPRYG